MPDKSEILANAVVEQNDRLTALETRAARNREAIIAAAERVRSDVDQILERVKHLESEVTFTDEELHL